MIYDNSHNVDFDTVSYGTLKSTQDKKFVLPMFLKADDGEISPIFINLRKLQITNNLMENENMVKTVDCTISQVVKDMLMFYDESILEFMKKHKESIFKDNKEIDDKFLEEGMRQSFTPLRNSARFNYKLQPSKDLSIFNSKKESFERETFVKDTNFDCIVQLYGAWFASSKFGIIWKLSQVKINEKHPIQTCMFKEEVDDDDVFPDYV